MRDKLRATPKNNNCHYFVTPKGLKEIRTDPMWTTVRVKMKKKRVGEDKVPGGCMQVTERTQILVYLPPVVDISRCLFKLD